MADFDAVFFDLDGTLWDNKACGDYQFDVVLPKLSPHLPEDEPLERVHRHFNGALIEMTKKRGLATRSKFSSLTRFRHLLESYEIKKEGLARHLATRYDSARRLGMRSFVRRGACQVLRCLRRNGLTTGLITNGSHAVQRHTLSNLGLAQWLDYVVIGEIEGFDKPDPRLFHRAADMAEVSPEKMLFVGDSLITDILGASRAGVPAAWLHEEDARIPRGLPVPDYDIESLNDLLALVEET